MSYKIKVKTIDGNNLTFTNVASFDIEDSMVIFVDSKTNLKKQFSVLRTDIEEEKEVLK